MTKRRPLYLVSERTCHGKIIWYIRIAHDHRFQIEETYGTQKLVGNYMLALKPAQNGTSKKVKQSRLTEGAFD